MTCEVPVVCQMIIRGPSPKGQHVFPRTSGARNPIAIVKNFIFIFLQLEVVLQAKPCKGGRCNLEGWSRLLQISQTKKYTYLPAGGTIIWANTYLPITPTLYVAHSKTLYSQIPWMELNHIAIGHTHFRLDFFFSQKLELLLGILPDLHETWHTHSSAGPDLKLSIEFCSVKKCANY